MQKCLCIDLHGQVKYIKFGFIEIIQLYKFLLILNKDSVIKKEDRKYAIETKD